MITNAVSIRFLETPQVLVPSDIGNRSRHFQPQTLSSKSVNSGATSIKEVERGHQFAQGKTKRKYFSRMSSNLTPKTSQTPKYRTSMVSPTEKIQFNRIAPLQKPRTRPSDPLKNCQQKTKPIEFSFQQKKQLVTNKRFASMIKEALIRQQQNRNNPKQIETDSEESSKNLSSKKLFNPLALDDFQRGKFLGKGQFGQVYAVRHKVTGFVCAMKIIEKSYIVKQKLEIQLAREIKIHSVMNHPNINQMYGYFWDSERIYLLLELCLDGQVFKILKKRRRTTQKQAAFIVKQMVDAVSYLHSLNVIHRDLKPQNLIMHDGLIKLIDFGWATCYQGRHRNTLCGTPLYYSPEMVKKQSYDFNVDIWSIGIMAYELLVGNIPFSIWTEMELDKIANEEIKFPTYLQMSASSKQFILSILQKDPKKRMKLQDMLKHQFLKHVNLFEAVDLFADE